jgi:hypothetical protein
MAIVHKQKTGIVASLIALALTACSSRDETPDFGLFKNGADHVATIHGFVDNFEECQRVASWYNEHSANSGAESRLWSCAALTK